MSLYPSSGNAQRPNLSFEDNTGRNVLAGLKQGMAMDQSLETSKNKREDRRLSKEMRADMAKGFEQDKALAGAGSVLSNSANAEDYAQRKQFIEESNPELYKSLKESGLPEEYDSESLKNWGNGLGQYTSKRSIDRLSKYDPKAAMTLRQQLENRFARQKSNESRADATAQYRSDMLGLRDREVTVKEQKADQKGSTPRKGELKTLKDLRKGSLSDQDKANQKRWRKLYDKKEVKGLTLNQKEEKEYEALSEMIGGINRKQTSIKPAPPEHLAALKANYSSKKIRDDFKDRYGYLPRLEDL